MVQLCRLDHNGEIQDFTALVTVLYCSMLKQVVKGKGTLKEQWSILQRNEIVSISFNQGRCISLEECHTLPFIPNLNLYLSGPTLGKHLELIAIIDIGPSSIIDDDKRQQYSSKLVTVASAGTDKMALF